MKSFKMSCCVTVLAGLFVFGAAAAQAKDSKDSSGDEGLEEVVVTAQRVAEDVQKVSVSVSVISDEEIAKTGAGSIDQVLRNVPSLNLMGNFGNVYLRGVGSNQAPGGDGDPGVNFYVDGASSYTGSNNSSLSQLVDVERVEVLRGPQGTLYGRNSTGGAVNISTKDPVLGKFEGQVSTKFGDYSLRSYAGVINVPLGDTLALRATATRETRDGYIHDATGTPIGGDSDVLNARAKVLWQPSENFSILGKFNYQSDKSNSPLLTTNVEPGNPPSVTIPVPFPPFSLTFNAPGHPRDPWVNAYGALAVANPSKTYIYQADVRYNSSVADFVLTPSRTVIDTVCNQPPCNSTHQSQSTVEFRASNRPDSKVKWVTGLYYLEQEGAGNTALSTNISAANVGTFTDPVTGFPVTDANGVNVHIANAQTILPTRNYAAYGQLTYPLTDTTRVKAGMRYSRESKRNQYVLYGVTLPASTAATFNAAGTCANCIVAFKNNPVLEDTAGHPVTYTGGLEHDLTDRNMLYGTVSTGFKVGGISAVTIQPSKYEPEHLTAFAIGSKNRFLGNRLQLNAEAYLYRYDNFQINLANTTAVTILNGSTTYYDPSEFQSRTYNAGLGTIKGFEVESVWEPTNRDRVTFNAAYAHGTYGPLTASLAGGPPGIPPTFTLTGGRMAFQPEWTLNGGYGHTFDLLGGKLTPRVDVRYSSEYLTTAESYLSGLNSFPLEYVLGHGQYTVVQPAYTKWDAYLVWVNGSGNFTLNAFGRNLGNHYEVEFLYPSGEGITPPRTYGAGFSFKF